MAKVYEDDVEVEFGFTVYIIAIVVIGSLFAIGMTMIIEKLLNA